MGNVQWVPDAPAVRWLGAVVPELWFDSGCGGPRARWLADGRIEIEGQGVPTSKLPAAVPQWYGEVAKAAAKHGVPVQLVVGVLATESGGNSKAVSPAGAAGLMQLMPDTANDLAKRKVSSTEILDPELNIDLGTKYIRELWNRYKGNPIKIAAGYNAGSVICGAPKKCPNGPNQWNVVTDCSGGKAVDYPARMFGYSNAALAEGVSSVVPKEGWSWWQVALGGLAVAGVGLALWKPGLVRGLVGARSNPVANPISSGGRRLEERSEYPDVKIVTEWEPSSYLPEGVPSRLRSPDSAKEWRELVRWLNDAAKKRGDNTRYRSVEEDNW